jgi:GDP-D-mannose 3', 5'-epimerase
MIKRGKVLVAGGSGMIGVSLTDKLIKKKINVVSTYYNNKPKKKKIYQKFNFLNYEDCLRATKNIETVYLLTMVSQGISGIKNNEADFVLQSLKININLIQASVKNKVKQIIFLSSSTLYQPSDKAISEKELNYNIDPYDIYLGLGWYFRYIEKLLIYFHKKKFLQSKIVRTGAVYGKNDSLDLKKSRVVPSLIMRMLNSNVNDEFEIWGNSNITRDFVYSEDIAQVLFNLKKTSLKCEPINFSSGKGENILNLAKKIDKILKKNLKFRFNPNLPTSVKYRVLSNNKFNKTILKTHRTNLDSGLKKTINWYKLNY